MKTSILAICVASHALLAAVHAHGDHGSGERPDDWALYHLLEEHRTLLRARLSTSPLTPPDISNFDAPSFFALHDFNNDGVWTPDEVRRTYGLDDHSLKDVAPETKSLGVKKIMALYDPQDTGSISRRSFIELNGQGIRLPDLNLGPGHHGDDEYEYEIHHFEKFHGADATEEDLIHPEDIEHFRKHDEMEDEEIRVAKEQSQSIVEANIPLKFRKQT